MKKLILGLIIGLGLTAGVAYAASIFNSQQTGNSVCAGCILQTNGANPGTSTWVATSTLGIIGGSATTTINGLQGPTFTIAAGTNITVSSTSNPNIITINSTASGSSSSILPLIANGTVAGVNASSSQTSFTVQGTGNLNPLNVTSSTGASLLYVNANGDVSIGTSSPQDQLFLSSLGTANGLKLGAGAGSGIGYINSFGQVLQMQVNGANLLTFNAGNLITSPATVQVGGGTWNSGGTVGINTTTPSAQLQVQASGGTTPLIISSSTGASLLTLSGAGLLNVPNLTISSLTGTQCLQETSGVVSGAGSACGSGSGGVATTSPFTNGFVPYATSTLALTNSAIFTNGLNTGIGTTSLANILTVGGSTLIQPSVNGLNTFAINNASGTPILLVNSLATSTVPIYTLGTSTGPTNFALLNNGNIGIDTTTPTQNFSIAGNMQLTGAYVDANATSGTSGMLLQTTGTGTQWVATSTLGISGGSGVTGGTNGKVAVFTGATTLSTGDLLDNLTVSGVNATSSIYNFNIKGTGALNPFNVSSSSGTSIFTIASTTNIGIGTTNPAYPLEIDYSDPSFTASGFTVIDTAGNQANFAVQGGTGANPYQMQISESGSAQAFVQNFSPGAALYSTINTIGNQLNFYVSSGNFSAKVLAITALVNTDVGIGTATPSSQLQIQATAGVKPLIISSSTGATMFTILANGNTGIATSTPGFKFASVGTAQLTGLATSGASEPNAICQDSSGQLISDSLSGGCVVSSERFKTNIQPLSSDLGLNLFLNLPANSYYFKSDWLGSKTTDPNYNGEQLGVIAENVAKIAPELATVQTATSTYDNTPPGTITGVADFSHWLGPITLAFQQQQKEIQNITIGKVKRSVEENWQWFAIVGQFILFIGYIIYNEKRRK